MQSNLDKIFDIEKTIKKFSNLIKKVIVDTSPQIDQSDMDDIEQEIYIIIWKEFIKSEKNIHYPYSYIRRVAYTTTSRMMKSVSKRRQLFATQQEKDQEILDVKGNIHYFGNQLDEGELMEILNNIIDNLVESRGKVLKMHFMGMHLDEIAEFLGWSNGKVRNLLYRGMNDLKEKLKEVGIEYNL